ncbi:MAG: glycosyltransferase [Pseudomonadota bacterium]|nr:glycosyltransferase [Pseudomonadota bacterium]
MSPRVLIHVQHLLGVGHLQRAAILADSLDAAGASVTLVSGGFPAPQILTRPGVRLEQLPPARAADASFTTLLDGDGNPLSDAWKAERQARLLALHDAIRPDALVTELFPLGRRQFRGELLTLLQHARPTVRLVACSVRDIVNRRPKREAEALDWLDRFYDLLLVHADPALVRIEDSVPGIGRFRGDVVHTGYISRPGRNRAAPAPSGEVLVAAGGGAAGEKLFAAAAAARPLSAARVRTWRFRHGRETDPARVGSWRNAAGDGAILEPVAPDFIDRMAAAAVVVCQLGYNTATELLATGTRAVIVPFAGGSETEQERRAAHFARLGYTVIAERDLDPVGLAHAVDAALAAPPPPVSRVDLDGARIATEAILGRLART